MSGRLITHSLALSAALVGFSACAPNNNVTLKTAAGLNAGIIGGTDATGNEEFAKTVVLLYDKQVGAICTASIISDKLLLTAGHCVGSAPTSLFVVFGTDVSATDIIVRRVVATQATPVWAARQGEDLNTGDMAMVGFVGGLPPGYKPAKMLGDASQLKDGETVTLAGYGLSDGVAATGAGKLRYVDTTIQKAAYTESEVLMEQSNGKGACHGDSGGPAYINGVNDPDNHCGVSAAYTSIAYYADWVKSEATTMSANVDQIFEALKKAQAAKDSSQDPAAAAQAPQQAPQDSSSTANQAQPKKRSHKGKSPQDSSQNSSEAVAS
jgi:hypothetical protein